MDDVKILVVEDLPLNQKMLSLQLQKLGFNADFVSNGLEALEAFDRKDYDIILMDCGMDQMDGYDATSEIRKREREGKRKRSTIIAVTARATAEERKKCFEVGMDDFLARPHTLEELELILAKHTESIGLD
jgi:CheY-like chemotaxis protein